MMGTAENDAPESFWRANVDEAAALLAAILREERADILTAYDEHGTYGHPDHIQVHRVGVRAAQLAETPRVVQGTANRDHVMRGLEAARAAGVELPGDLDDRRMDDFGSPESIITTAIDVSGYLDRKRAAMKAHASQISETSFFLAMPPELFATAFGTEWFIDPTRTPGGAMATDLLTDRTTP